jgi:hypothetical protein
MTMDLYGHLIDQNLWDAAKRVGEASGDNTGIREPNADELQDRDRDEQGP